MDKESENDTKQEKEEFKANDYDWSEKIKFVKF